MTTIKHAASAVYDGGSKALFVLFFSFLACGLGLEQFNFVVARATEIVASPRNATALAILCRAARQTGFGQFAIGIGAIGIGGMAVHALVEALLVSVGRRPFNPWFPLGTILGVGLSLCLLAIAFGLAVKLSM